MNCANEPLNIHCTVPYRCVHHPSRCHSIAVSRDIDGILLTLSFSGVMAEVAAQFEESLDRGRLEAHLSVVHFALTSYVFEL